MIFKLPSFLINFPANCVNAGKVLIRRIRIYEMSQNRDIFKNAFCAHTMHLLQKYDINNKSKIIKN